MRTTRVLLISIAVLAIAPHAQAQRRGGGTATLAVSVTDSSGSPIGGVLVTVEGAASRQARTERGQIAFEDLPPGNYRLRFEHEQFVTLERELTARAGAPMDVKVVLTPAPKPLPPPEPVAPPPVKAEPVTIDISAFIEKNFVGRASSKTSALACAAGGSATLVQVREPLKEDAATDVDRFLYVIAGAGNARIGAADQPLQAGVFVMIPRGVGDALSVRGRNPLVLLSIKAGGTCAAPQALR
jgi:mannose-6-phosphate isomerase-like protein (cupin superfamily)